MALTDASFLVFWTLAIGAGLQFLDQPGFRSAILLGGAVGLAQEFKYNGWLMGGIVLATQVTGLISKKQREPSQWLHSCKWGALAVTVAWLLVWPWYLFVENHGGYAGLLKHQRSYLGGWSAWGPNLIIQSNQAVMLAGPYWLTCGGGLMIAGSLLFLSPSQPQNFRFWLRSCAAGMLAIPFLPSPVLTGLLVIPSLQLRTEARDRLLTVGWLSLLILSPFYHPYARLWLPIESFHWLFLGRLVARLEQFFARFPGKMRVDLRSTWIVGLSLIAVNFFYLGTGSPSTNSGRSKTSGTIGPERFYSLARLADHRTNSRSQFGAANFGSSRAELLSCGTPSNLTSAGPFASERIPRYDQLGCSSTRRSYSAMFPGFNYSSLMFSRSYCFQNGNSSRNGRLRIRYPQRWISTRRTWDDPLKRSRPLSGCFDLERKIVSP